MATAMRLEVIRATNLRAKPATAAKILRKLSTGEFLIAAEVAGEWTRVGVSPGDVTGWVLTRDCRWIPESATKASDLKGLTVKRAKAAASPIGLPRKDAPESDNEVFPGPLFDDDDGGQRQYQKNSVDRYEPEKQITQQEQQRQQGDRYRRRLDKTAAKAAPAAADTVDVSVFGPQTLHAGGACMVQVFLHTLDQGTAVAASAREADAASGRRGAKTLATEIARGTRVQVMFEGLGLLVAEAMQELIWRGEPDACQFIVGAPADAADTTFYPRILVLVNSVPVGAVSFALPASARKAAATAVLRGDEARRYSYAFLSYSSKDRAEVLKRAQGLKAGRIDFFQDILSLEPGEKWVPRLDQEIDRCDLFLLFWSSHAKTSEWVAREVNYALARQKSSGGLPDITPVIIEGPPPPSPPDTLKDIHFNDSLIYVLAAVEAQPPKPT